MKDIMLRIVGRQIDRNDEVSEETVEFMTEGKAYKKGGATYLVYEESEMSGLAGVKTTLRIGDDGSVRMKRFGSGIMLDTVMEFHQGKRDVYKRQVKQAVEEFGKVDILVNNAGITNDKLLLRMTQEDFMKVVDTNLLGTFHFTKYAAAHMAKKRYGRIINLSSISAVRGNAGQANYCASKAGVIGMTLSNSKELGKRNITVNAIAPGFIETDMTTVLSEKQKELVLGQISLGRYGKAEDVAKAAAFLASDGAAYITGQIIGVDGGMIL